MGPCKETGRRGGSQTGSAALHPSIARDASLRDSFLSHSRFCGGAASRMSCGYCSMGLCRDIVIRARLLVLGLSQHSLDIIIFNEAKILEPCTDVAKIMLPCTYNRGCNPRDQPASASVGAPRPGGWALPDRGQHQGAHRRFRSLQIRKVPGRSWSGYARI